MSVCMYGIQTGSPRLLIAVDYCRIGLCYITVCMYYSRKLIYVCIYVLCMYICMYYSRKLLIYVCMYIHSRKLMYVCMYVCSGLAEIRQTYPLISVPCNVHSDPKFNCTFSCLWKLSPGEIWICNFVDHTHTHTHIPAPSIFIYNYSLQSIPTILGLVI